MDKFEKQNFKYEEPFHYSPETGEPLSELAKKREELKLHNAGLLYIAKLSKQSKNVEVQKEIKKFLEANKKS